VFCYIDSSKHCICPPNKFIYAIKVKVGCMNPVACTRSGSGFPSSVALDGNPEPAIKVVNLFQKHPVFSELFSKIGELQNDFDVK
jgi:hypothetical protein